MSAPARISLIRLIPLFSLLAGCPDDSSPMDPSVPPAPEIEASADATGPRPPATASHAQPAPADAAQPLMLTLEDLDAFEQGVTRENELLERALARVEAASEDPEKRAAVLAALPESIEPQSAAHAGLSPARYEEVKERIGQILGAAEVQSAEEKDYGAAGYPGGRDPDRAGEALFAHLATDVATELRVRHRRLAVLRARNAELRAWAAGR